MAIYGLHACVKHFGTVHNMAATMANIMRGVEQALMPVPVRQVLLLRKCTCPERTPGTAVEPGGCRSSARPRIQIVIVPVFIRITQLIIVVIRFFGVTATTTTHTMNSSLIVALGCSLPWAAPRAPQPRAPFPATAAQWPRVLPKARCS